MRNKYSEGTQPAYYRADLTLEQVQGMLNTNYNNPNLKVKEVRPLEIDDFKGGFQINKYSKLKFWKKDEINKIRKKALKEGEIFVEQYCHKNRANTKIHIAYGSRPLAEMGYNEEGIEGIINDNLAQKNDIPLFYNKERAYLKVMPTQRIYICEVELNDGTTRLLYGVLEPDLENDNFEYKRKRFADGRYFAGFIPEFNKKRRAGEGGPVSDAHTAPAGTQPTSNHLPQPQQRRGAEKTKVVSHLNE